jgi:hypothetical protein
MKIGIDISQIVYRTGVSNYLKKLVDGLVKSYPHHEYVLFGGSFRMRKELNAYIASLTSQYPTVRITPKIYPLTPSMLDVLWNRLHVVPVEWLIGDIDVFISSDWTEPPILRAKKATIVYDMIVYTHPEETDRLIRAVHKRKLAWVAKETDVIICISEATKRDIIRYLGEFVSKKIEVVYPGL